MTRTIEVGPCSTTIAAGTGGRGTLRDVNDETKLHERMLEVVEDALADDAMSLVRRLGLGPSDVPQLVAFVRTWPESCADQSPAGWVPMLASRALAELGEPSAVTEVLAVLDALDEAGDDSVFEELSWIAAEIGAPAFDPLATYLRDVSHRELSRLAACDALEALVRQKAEHRERFIEVLVAVLDEHAPQTPSLNGCVIGTLVELDAVEHAERIRLAFAAGVVDETTAGGWARVAEELGLEPAPADEEEVSGRVVRDAAGRAKNKAARKRAKAARKKGRR